jgi:hypothetical protein
MFNNAKEESAHFEQEAFDERVNQEVERKTDEMLENLEIDTVHISMNGDRSMALNINGIDFGVDVAHIELLKQLCITVLQEVDNERMYEANELEQQWSDQEDEEPSPYTGTYSEI